MAERADEARDSTLYIRFKKPDGDVVILPACNRETYERKGYRALGHHHLEPGEMAPHEAAPPADLVHEPDAPRGGDAHAEPVSASAHMTPAAREPEKPRAAALTRAKK